MASTECSVCLVAFDPAEHLLKAFPCQHTFCALCVDNLPGQTGVKCPTCRRECQRSDVKTNFALADVLMSSRCKACSDGQKSCLCLHCGQGLCGSCLATHTQDFYADAKRKLADLDTTCRESLNLSMDRTVTREQHDREDRAIADMRKTVDKYRMIVDELEKQLEEKIRSRGQENRGRVAEWTTALDRANTEVRQFLCQAEGDLRGDPTGIPQEVMRKAINRCGALQAELDKITTNRPHMTEYHFRPAELVTPDLGEISVPQTVQPQAASVSETKNQQAVDYGAIKFKSMTRSKGSGDDQFNSPRFVTCSENRIYVTDIRNHRVKVYDQNLKLISTFGSEGEGLHEFKNPSGVTINEQGELFVADSSNNRTKILNAQGQVTRTFGQKGSAPGQFDNPQGIATGPTGDLYICDSRNRRVHVLRPDGSYVRSIGSRGSNKGEFARGVTDVTVTDTKVIVKEHMKLNLHVFDLTGRFLETWPKGLPKDLRGDSPCGLCADKHQNVLVTYDSGRVVVLSPQGEYLQTFGSPGDGPGELSGPCGVAVSGRGEVVVCDWGNNRVVIFGS